jgi:predicted cupin superfamily sugar epimerase
MHSIEKIVEHFQLKPLPWEGGYYHETYRSAETIPASALGGRYAGERSVSTAIYYMLTPETISAMHRLTGDEMFHFYLGDPVEMLQLFPDGSSEIVTLGQDIFNGMKLQQVVPGGVWQGSRLVKGGKFALLGTTVAPGFDFADFAMGDAGELKRRYPARAGMIGELSG